MLTPQDIQEQEFSKAVFGGYDMAAVDDFLEELGNDYAALYKDNAVLKGKLKVLVDKVEEYRSTEDAMRMALLTAQRMSDDMMAETKAKCEAMIADADKDAAARHESLLREIASEEKRLEAAKRETAKFVAAARELGARHTEFLAKISEITADYDTPREEHEPVRSPEPEVNTKKPETAPKKEAEPEDKVADINSFVNDIMSDTGTEPAEDLEATKRVPDISEALKAAQKPEKAEWTEEDEELTPRPKFKFDDLQFGSNYNDGKK